ncbi:SGNH/GDSL hydrolase family protein [Duganella sp. FT92W]|uniref:SGNH/GDSL hydrolase family protein n=1 Tax=Pseudoduganella rivuli TaxID=2666085 RepID=A0A7X2IUW7_9BURK|nr:SGNH/GDSL hydrolase family protein [Pseudoduganella rivuli]MRV76572.1 SGNH/GDSL hydrolase family protein [Pseudoduganella rivuli]
MSANLNANEYAQHKKQIQEDLDKRIAKYRARTGAQKMMLKEATLAGPKPLNLLAQGDSWFDYPLPPLSHSDIIAHLEAMPLSPSILNLAHHGEAAEEMLGVQKLRRLTEQLNAPHLNAPFDAILFSGGGNDLVGDQFRLWLNNAAEVSSDPAQGLRPARVDAIFGIVKAAYEDLISARNQAAQAQNRRIPIFTHSYDFAIPTGKGVCGAGPWLKPSLDDRGWDKETGKAIVHQLLAQFADLLTQLQNAHKDFFHIATQGALTSVSQWDNELHPTPKGFALVSAKFVAALRAEFPGRI